MKLFCKILEKWEKKKENLFSPKEPEKQSSPHVIFLVINKEKYLQDILTAFVEAGVTGATIIDSMGIGRRYDSDVPIFAGLEEAVMEQHSNIYNVTVFTIVKDENRMKKLVNLIEKIINFDEAGEGILFIFPVTYVKGISSEELSL